MAIMMNMRWPGVTAEQYDQVRSEVGWEQDLPDGGVVHVAAYDGQAMRITDVWDSAEQFQAFVDQRLMPGVQKVGISGQPEVEISELHALFTPGLK